VRMGEDWRGDCTYNPQLFFRSLRSSQRDELLMQLNEARHASKGAYEQKLEKEIARLREDSTREMQEIRNNSNQVWERENKMLREQKADAVKQYEMAMSDIQELRNVHEALVLSHAKMGSEQESAVMEIRNDLKMKDFEVAKLSATLEEIRGVKKEGDLLVEHLRAQLAVHQSEFANLKQEAKADKEILLDKIRGKDEQLEVRR